MRRRLTLLILLGALAAVLVAAAPAGAAPGACTTIAGGTLLGPDGAQVASGYDQWGYNYQARLFNGRYCDYLRNAAWCGFIRDMDLVLKWNDAYLSGRDCDGDGSLDRHLGYPSYRGSGAWYTQHQSGEYPAADGTICHWTTFAKVVAVPADAIRRGVNWETADGTEIGPAFQGDFAIIQMVQNDPCQGLHGISLLSPLGGGLGTFAP